LYEEYDYIETDVTDKRFLKLKTSLLTHPDFILGRNPVKSQIRYMVDNKRDVISLRPYQFCYDCFNRDFDIAASGYTKGTHCAVCGSDRVSYELPAHKAKKSFL
jgi:hypothetical protein